MRLNAIWPIRCLEADQDETAGGLFGVRELAQKLIMKLSHKIGICASVVGIAVIGSRLSSQPESEIAPAPLVLEKVQSLGELHTARYTYQNVFEHTTSRSPAEWATYVPGAASLVRSSTQNSALVEIHGDVEAGVDLSKAHLEERPGQNPRLILPHAVVYRPNVDAVLHDVKVGMFWRDDNIALEAERNARFRLREAARQQGIVAQAEKNVLPQLAKLVPAKVEILFQ